MEQIGYSLVGSSGSEIRKFGDTKGQLPSPPPLLILPNGDQVMGFKVGDVFSDGSYFVERWLDDSSYGDEISRSIVFDGEKVVVTVERFIAPPTKIELAAYASNKRYEKEVGGITVGDVPIATDDRSKQMILGARVAADANPEFSTPWVGADESVTMVDATTMIAISNAVLLHVATCFGIYALVKAGIDADEVTTTEQIDAAFA